MSDDNEIVDVLFRVSKDDRDDVFALFPEVLSTMDDPSQCLCFQHVGQHNSAHLADCIRTSRAARPAEYHDLKQELEGRGYKLNVVSRVITRHNKRRLESLRRLLNRPKPAPKGWDSV